MQSRRSTLTELKWVFHLLHTTAYLICAQTYIKLEQYGYAIQDADTAIELDPNNVKVQFTQLAA